MRNWLCRAIPAIRLRRVFTIEDDAELAIECDPRALSCDIVEGVGAEGFTRASLGVQEFDPAVQQAINRIQPPDMVENAVAMLRAAGVRGINFDLLYGLPKQTVDMVVKTAQQCLAFAPDRVALFGYAHVPWFAKNQRMIQSEDLPGLATRMAQANAAGAVLKTKGYKAIGMDHYAQADDTLARVTRKGQLRRNFQGYTADDSAALIGFGVSAIGATPKGYVQNAVDTKGWARALEQGRLPVAKGRALTREDKLRGRVIERIMCLQPVDLAQMGVERGFGADWWTDALRYLNALEQDGLITMQGSKLWIEEGGRPYVRVVAALFDTYLQTPEARHSIAV